MTKNKMKTFLGPLNNCKLNIKNKIKYKKHENVKFIIFSNAAKV